MDGPDRHGLLFGDLWSWSWPIQTLKLVYAGLSLVVGHSMPYSVVLRCIEHVVK